MRNRVSRRTGKPLNVGVHFVVGACDPEAEFAPTWQLADPGLVATTHLGLGWLNARSVGVEVVSAGVPGPANSRGRREILTPLFGRSRRFLEFFPGQLRSWVRLADALAAGSLPGGIQIPRRVPRDVDGMLPGAPPRVMTARRFSEDEARLWSGAAEHYLTPGTKKIDAAGLLIGALADAGWRIEVP
jgi:hypothetical protein